MSLQSDYPSVAAEWHPYQNGDLKPESISSNSHESVWWMRLYIDPKTGRQFTFEWQARIQNRTVLGRGCPFLSGKAVYPGFNDLQSQFPDVAKEWHPNKNGDLSPDKVLSTGKNPVWWLLHYTDPKSGKEFDFEWEAPIYKRTVYGQGCPFLTGHKVYPGFNDLLSQCPKIANQWHPLKNGSLSPDRVTVTSNRSVWWFLSYNDPKTGKHFDFEWVAPINGRVQNNSDCPYLTGNAVWPGFNDLASRFPDIASQWNYRKNGELQPNKVLFSSPKKVWWIYPYDDIRTGTHFEFEWESRIYSRTVQGEGCPQLCGKQVEEGFNDLASQYPSVADQWHPSLNKHMEANAITYSSTKKVWWYLPYYDKETGKTIDFAWKAKVCNRTLGKTGCPYLTGHAVYSGFNDLASKYPNIALEWHTSRNGSQRPETVYCKSKTKYWWKCPSCGNEWRASVYSRINGTVCPRCQHVSI